MILRPLCLLTSCLLAGVFAQSTSAGVINVNAGGNLTGAITSAHSGDIVSLGAGTFNVSAPITIPSDVTVMGVSASSTHVVFNLAGGNTTSYGFIIAGNASNVSIAGLDVYSNHGLIAMDRGSKYTNIVIARNNFQYGGGQFSSGTLVFGITGSIPNYGLQIVHNYFHDSPASYRNWVIWYAVNANLDYNLFYNIVDGGQIESPGNNVSFSYNYGTNMHRMGQEVSIQSNSNFTCNGNIFYNYVNPYYDTEGVSIVGGTGDVEITNNYFAASGAKGTSWGDPDGGGLHRFGYAVECTGRPANVTGNTFVGYWAELVASDMLNASVTNNSVFGSGIWANFAGEPGPFGQGSVHASNNSIDSKLTDAPTPPANAHAGPLLHSN